MDYLERLINKYSLILLSTGPYNRTRVYTYNSTKGMYEIIFEFEHYNCRDIYDKIQNELVKNGYKVIKSNRSYVYFKNLDIEKVNIIVKMQDDVSAIWHTNKIIIKFLGKDNSNFLSSSITVTRCNDFNFTKALKEDDKYDLLRSVLTEKQWESLCKKFKLVNNLSYCKNILNHYMFRFLAKYQDQGCPATAAAADENVIAKFKEESGK
jgi:hypothetical protein